MVFVSMEWGVSVGSGVLLLVAVMTMAEPTAPPSLGLEPTLGGVRIVDALAG